MTVRRVSIIALSLCAAGLLTMMILRRWYAPALEFWEVALISGLAAAACTALICWTTGGQLVDQGEQVLAAVIGSALLAMCGYVVLRNAIAISLLLTIIEIGCIVTAERAVTICGRLLPGPRRPGGFTVSALAGLLVPVLAVIAITIVCLRILYAVCRGAVTRICGGSPDRRGGRTRR